MIRLPTLRASFRIWSGFLTCCRLWSRIEIVEGPVGISGEPALEVLLEDAEALLDALVDRLGVDLDALGVHLLLGGEQGEERPAAAAELKDGRPGVDPVKYDSVL